MRVEMDRSDVPKVIIWSLVQPSEEYTIHDTEVGKEKTTKPFRAQSLPEFQQCICRNISQSISNMGQVNWQKIERPHLFVEYPISLIDVRDVALFLVQPLAREFRLLVNTGQSKVSWH